MCDIRANQRPFFAPLRDILLTGEINQLNIVSTFRLLGVLLIFLAPARSAWAADFVNGWSFLQLGMLPRTQDFLSSDIPLGVTSLKAGGVVDANSTPANPFPGTERALYLAPAPDNGQLRIRTRPFLAETPASGSYETTFRIIDGTFYLGVGVITLPWEPKDERTLVENERLFAFRFVPDEALICETQRGLKSEDVNVIATEENYAFRIEWLTAGETVEFRFFLNGKPVLTPAGEPFVLPVAQSKLAEGSLGFVLSSGSPESPCATMFLGGIAVETPAH